MVSDPGFTDEDLKASIDILNLQIEGLDLLSKAGLSNVDTSFVMATLAARQRRRDLILSLIAARGQEGNAKKLLVADGFPDFTKLNPPAELAVELQKERAAFEAALELFGIELRASMMKVNLNVAPRE